MHAVHHEHLFIEKTHPIEVLDRVAVRRTHDESHVPSVFEQIAPGPGAAPAEIRARHSTRQGARSNAHAAPLACIAESRERAPARPNRAHGAPACAHRRTAVDMLQPLDSLGDDSAGIGRRKPISSWKTTAAMFCCSQDGRRRETVRDIADEGGAKRARLVDRRCDGARRRPPRRSLTPARSPIVSMRENRRVSGTRPRIHESSR